MSSGFIYVLVNSSMPGLVKIGKTTRRPSDRVKELSGVTGVPTPFVVAYEEYFADCDEAEKYLHSNLSNSGIRVSESREFFRASATDVVKMIAAMPVAISKGRQPSIGRNGVYETRSQRLDSCTQDLGFAALLKKQSEARHKWSGLHNAAFQFRFGGSGFLPEPDKAEPHKAFDLYLQAADLGSAAAFRYLGEMCLYSECDAARPDAAFDYFVKGAKLGDYRCRLFIAYASLQKGELAKSRNEIGLFLKELEQDLGYEEGGASGSQNADILMLLIRATLNESIPWEDKTKLFFDLQEYWPRIRQEAQWLIEEDSSCVSRNAIAAKGILKLLEILSGAPSNVASHFR